jgi:hydrogenase nickel incorporation protein HypB
VCAICGCDDGGEVRLVAMTDALDGPHEPAAHSHGHDADGHRHEAGRTIVLEQQILAKNDRLAEHNRDWLQERGVLAVNVMSSPGSGKTTLLERTIRDLGEELRVSVIEGDQETPLDAERIRATGSPVVQINTGSGCHLDAAMVERALHVIDPPAGSIVFIENVGNLVCPALFDLGEQSRVVLASVTEGADKPLKYPQMFRHADLVVLNKADLLPYVSFEVADFVAAVGKVNPAAEILVLSATTGDGLGSWYGELRRLKAVPAGVDRRPFGH